MVIIHLNRLLCNLPEIWTLVIQHFVFIASNTQSIELQLQACDTICHIASQGINVDQGKVLSPLKELACLSGDVPKRALATLHNLLQVHGATIREWHLIYAIFQGSVSDDSLIRVAFPSLELVCSEYLSSHDQETTKLCVATLSMFACESADVNISLTCVRLLWTISDTSKDKDWLFVLCQFLNICRDKRPQVRNGCVTSLFRSIKTNGTRLTPDLWHSCLDEVIIPLLTSALETSSSDSTSDRSTTSQSIMLHHTRDTFAKQWDETRVLAVQGLGILVGEYAGSIGIEHFTRLMNLMTRYATDAALEVRIAAAKLLCNLSGYAALDSKFVDVLCAASKDVITLLVSQTLQTEDTKGVQLNYDLIDSLGCAICSLVSRIGFPVEHPGHSFASVFSLMEILLKMSCSIQDHPNDMETVANFQKRFVELSLQQNLFPFERTAKFLDKVICLPLNQNSAHKFPTFLAVSRFAMSSIISCLEVRTITSSDNESLILLSESLTRFLISNHTLHSAASEVYSSFVAVVCPSERIDASSPLVVESAVKSCCLYLKSRKLAQSSSEDHDITVMKRFAQYLPLAIAHQKELLDSFLSSIEHASRFSGGVSSIEKMVSNAVVEFSMHGALSPEISKNSSAKEVAQEVSPSQDSKKFTQSGAIPTPVREKFTTAALVLLAELCQHTNPAISTSALQIFLNRAKGVLRSYLNDNPPAMAAPLPRLREIEVNLVLEHLSKVGTSHSERKTESPMFSMYFLVVRVLPTLQNYPTSLGWACNYLLRIGDAFGLSPEEEATKSIS
jgi:hypothetical protein